MMQSDCLKALLAVKDAGSISTAAKIIGKSPSQLSAWLTSLEIDIGVTLINREGYRAYLTPEGEVIARHAKDVLSELANIDSKIVASASRDHDQLNIALLDALPVEPFRDALWQLQQYKRDVGLNINHLHTNNILDGIDQGALDFGVIFFHGNVYPGMTEHIIGYTEIVTVVATNHVLAQKKHEFSTDERLGHLQLLPSSYLGFGIDKVSKYSENYWLLDNFEMLLALLEKGVGWTELPRHWVDPLLKAGKLVQLKPKGVSALWWPLQLVWQKHRPLNSIDLWLIDKMTNPKPGLAVAGLPFL
ncbi:LysR family transcriptional regulator [Photobacterium sanguinicancri]|uniref:LysR family transcriptional regulator n=1 Tax=Photobacterium sanguinicancri TaxID=875932 RepID=UPI003D11FE1A